MTPETTQKRPKRPWSRGDKLLIIVPAVLAALAFGLFFWLRAANTLPASLPPHPMPAINARDYYSAATNALVDINKIEFAVIPWNPRAPHGIGSSSDDHFYSLAAKEKLVTENARALSLLHQGFQYPYQETPMGSFSTTFPHLQRIRRLARFLSFDGQVKAAEGDWNGAVNTELDAVQMGETLPRGGALIGMLVGVACQAIGRKHIWEAVPHLSGPEALAAARRLEAIRAAHVPFADTVQEEKWGTQSSLRELMAKPDWATQISTNVNGRNPTFSQDPKAWAGNVANASYARLIGRGKILADNARWMEETLAQARQPYAAHLPPPAVPNDPVNQMLLSSYTKVRLNEVRADVQNALLVAMLALRAYHEDHKAYPPSLTALVPGYLNAVPTDPFALSGPLRYKLVGAKYVLYSVGPDGKDDGGKAIFDTTKLAPGPNDTSDQRQWTQDDSKGDVVAGVNTL